MQAIQKGQKIQKHHPIQAAQIKPKMIKPERI